MTSLSSFKEKKLAEFDKQFEESYDTELPTSDNIDAGREIVHYLSLKDFLSQSIQEAAEMAREEQRENLQFIWRWISRLNGDKEHDRPEKEWKTYVAVLTNSPQAPYQTGDWYEESEVSSRAKEFLGNNKNI